MAFGSHKCTCFRLFAPVASYPVKCHSKVELQEQSVISYRGLSLADRHISIHAVLFLLDTRGGGLFSGLNLIVVVALPVSDIRS